MASISGTMESASAHIRVSTSAIRLLLRCRI
jgi:hypothetical protein